MTPNKDLRKILEEITELKARVSQELEQQRKEFAYKLDRGKIVFSEEVLEKQKKFKQSLLTYLIKSKWTFRLTAPFIYMQIIPFLLLDIFVSIYQWTNFPVYKISKVKRGDYIIFDRHKLGYLNTLEKINCLYCSYVNGLIGYIREISSRTEQFFCPIRHAKKQVGKHDRYYLFTDYGDTQAYRLRLQELRRLLLEEIS